MIILTQARKGALSDDYQLEVTASNDPIFGERPSTLRLSPTCGQQVTRGCYALNTLLYLLSMHLFLYRESTSLLPCPFWKR